MKEEQHYKTDKFDEFVRQHNSTVSFDISAGPE